MAKKQSSLAASYDLIVIGAGPAGCTLATLVKKYAPRRRVLLVEKAPGPRHHIGESLLPAMVPVLKEMGVFEKVDAEGFPKKLGVTFIWGDSRKPWDTDFTNLDLRSLVERYGQGGAAAKEAERTLQRYGVGADDPVSYAWQVKRSRYDEILLQHAQESGVEVLRATTAESIVEKAGRVVGVRLRGPEKQSRRLSCGLLADCSGQNGFLTRFRRIREYNPHLNNVAAYAYFKGAKWKYRYTGHPDKTRIFVCSVDCGWLWYIPLGEDLVSVGLVTTAEFLKKNKIKNLRPLYLKELRRCEEIWPLLKSARQVEDFDGTGKDFFTHSDWSYLNLSASGPGWLAAGDAALFVDPILSSGVTLAHLSAQRAAYTLLTQWRVSAKGIGERLWNDYDVFCRETAAMYLVLALFWYGNDQKAQSWWGRAREIQRAWLPLDLSDQGAFVTVASGFPRYYERLFATPRLTEEHTHRPQENPFCDFVLKKDSGIDSDSNCGIAEETAVPRLLYPFREESIFLPDPGKGFLLPALRLRFIKSETGDAVLDAVNPRKTVTPAHRRLARAIDGRRSLRDIRLSLQNQGTPSWWFGRCGLPFLKDLHIQGVLELAAAPKKIPAGAKAKI